MPTVVVFHHVRGLTAGVVAFADRLRRAGHRVVTPDLFDGETFGSIEAGLAHVEATGGFGAVLERGGRAASDAPSGPAVYIGFSLGVVVAQMLAQTRPDAVGAVLCSSCVPMTEFGEAWPAHVPVQIHAMDRDPYFVDEGDLDAARAIVESSPSAELLLYPGDQHFFADSSSPGYDPEAAELFTRRVLDLLASL